MVQPPPPPIPIRPIVLATPDRLQGCRERVIVIGGHDPALISVPYRKEIYCRRLGLGKPSRVNSRP
jgi:hypothetical protein